MSDKNIYQRINAVMREVEYVQKDKAVTGGGQNYKAVTHDQLISVIRKSMVKNGIVVVPKQISGGLIIQRDLEKQVKMHLYEGSYKIVFVNSDKPEEYVSSSVQAHAADNGDKAPGKALTYATKSAMLKVFLLESGEDEESRSEKIEASTFLTNDQKLKIMSLISETNTDKAKFYGVLNIQNINDLSIKGAQKAIIMLEKKRENMNG